MIDFRHKYFKIYSSLASEVNALEYDEFTSNGVFCICGRMRS
jgi:hypothetical protein